MIEALTSKRYWRDFDWILLVTALLLCSVGLVEIHSSTLNMATGSLFLRQLLWVVLGVGILFLVASIDYRLLAEHIVLIYGVSIVVLITVLALGHESSGARSWFQLGSVGLQPSELAKLTVVIALAGYFSNLPKRYLTIREILVAVGICGLPVVLIALQPDLGTAMTFVPILLFGLFVRGIRPAILIAGSLIVIMLLPVGWYVMQDYQKDRILTFLQPEADPLGSGYQVIQSKIAIGSGGFWGKGVFEGSQNQLGFLPTRHTDFIFSVVAEELGFVGVAITLALLLVLVIRSLSVAMAPRDTLGLFLIVGITGMFAGHIIVNIGMVIGFLPSTGIPLPFLSYGGSAMLTAFAALGLIVSVRRCRYVN